VPVAVAEGTILAHSRSVDGKNYRKGRVLTADDVDSLRAAGIETVMAAVLEPGDIPEDEAARRLAAAICGPGLAVQAPFTGRCNLNAEVTGLLTIDRRLLNAINAVDEALTVACLAPWTAVRAGQMAATIKVIPFAVPDHVLTRCLTIARADGPPLGVRAFSPHSVGLIQTKLPGTKSSVLDKTAGVMAARLERLGSRLVAERRTEHSTDAVTSEIAGQLQAGCDMILIAGASAIVDRRDVIPVAIENAGGHIVHFGMPVDPGNLLLLGRHGNVPVIGLPGCARSPKYNGLDMVLERLTAGLEISGADIMAMGAGGLLKEMADRPQPRDRSPGKAAAHAPRIAAIVLAAGQSRRMGGINKLVAEIDGGPMVARVADAVLASRARPIVVVTGYEQDRVRSALAGRDVCFAHNPDYGEGLSTSLRTGLAALADADIDGAIICLGDMPDITAAVIDSLIAAYDPVEGRAICVPTYKGKRGNPVLWGRGFFADMAALTGDVGARHLIGANAEVVCEVPTDDDAVLLDIDSPDALAARAS